MALGAGLTVIVVGLGGVAYAVSGGGSNTISACASKRTGVLRLVSAGRHCKRSERAVQWNKTGPAGPAGQQGAPGSPGATGTVDTSSFYSKTQSDARYLPLHGVADNASALGGKDPSAYVRNGFGGQQSLRFLSTDVPAGSSDELYPALPAGRLTATCSDPATSSTLQYTFEPGSSGHIERVHGTTTTFGTTDSFLTTAVNDHVEYLVDYTGGDVAKLDVWVANGPDGSNVCRFRIFATVVVNTAS